MTPPPANGSIDDRRLAIVTDGHRDEGVGLALPFRRIELVTLPADDDAASRHDLAYVLVSAGAPAGLVTAAAALAQRSGAEPPTLLLGLGVDAPLPSSQRTELAAATQGWRYRGLVTDEPLPVVELVRDGDGLDVDIVALAEVAGAATGRSLALGEQLATAVAERERAEDDLRRVQLAGEQREGELTRLLRETAGLTQQRDAAQQRARELESKLGETERRLTQLRETRAVRATAKYRAWRRAIARRLPVRVRRMLR